MPKKQPKKTATRRPEYMPQHRWCCCCCRELHQLKTFAKKASVNDSRRLLAAMRITDRYVEIAKGAYGGVELAQLFD